MSERVAVVVLCVVLRPSRTQVIAAWYVLGEHAAAGVPHSIVGSREEVDRTVATRFAAAGAGGSPTIASVVSTTWIASCVVGGRPTAVLVAERDRRRAERVRSRGRAAHGDARADIGRAGRRRCDLGPRRSSGYSATVGAGQVCSARSVSTLTLVWQEAVKPAPSCAVAATAVVPRVAGGARIGDSARLTCSTTAASRIDHRLAVARALGHGGRRQAMLGAVVSWTVYRFGRCAGCPMDRRPCCADRGRP